MVWLDFHNNNIIYFFLRYFMQVFHFTASYYTAVQKFGISKIFYVF